jgi:N-ATPase, AtpR subunit
MINASLSPVIAKATTMAPAGFVFGLVYFVALKQTVILFVSGRGRLGPLAFTLGRMATAVSFLGLAAKFGAVSLLAALMGFWLARAVALRTAGGPG